MLVVFLSSPELTLTQASNVTLWHWKLRSLVTEVLCIACATTPTGVSEVTVRFYRELWSLDGESISKFLGVNNLVRRPVSGLP